MKKPVLGVLGGIGSGKSVVAAALARGGGALVNADALGHEALRQPVIRDAVLLRFGRDVATPEGEVDRKQLARKVFADVRELRDLEAIVFPYIQQRILEEIDKAQREPQVKYVVLDAAVMLEAGWAGVCDKLIFVDVPRDVRLERIRRQRGWTAAQVEARERAQWPAEEKLRRADAVIDNSGTLEETERQVAEWMGKWAMIK